MSTPFDDDDDAPDALTREYRRADADDDHRPAAATRAAILAEARRVAAAVTASARPATPLPPAANDAWWNWKAAASIAVMALAGVLSWRVFRTEPVLQQPTASAPASAPAVAMLESPARAPRAAAEPPVALAKSAAPAPAPSPPSAVARPAVKWPEAEADTSRAMARAEAPAAPAVVPRLAVTAATESVAAPQASMRQAVAGTIASDAATATGGAVADSSPLALMERYFPQAFGRPAGQSRPWILFDAHGAVLQSGEHPWQGLEELQGFLEQRMPAIRIARSDTGTVSNSRGQAVDYAFLWAAAAP